MRVGFSMSEHGGDSTPACDLGTALPTVVRRAYVSSRLSTATSRRVYSRHPRGSPNQRAYSTNASKLHISIRVYVRARISTHFPRIRSVLRLRIRGGSTGRLL